MNTLKYRAYNSILILFILVSLICIAVNAAIPASGALSGTVSGRVTDDTGRPLANVSVGAGDTLGVLTDYNGNYTLGLPFGQYTISSPRGERMGLNDGLYVQQTRNITLSEDKSAFNVDFVLVRGGLISGMVKDTTGKPLAGISMDAGEKGWALTDANGTYIIKGLPFGDLSVGAPSRGRWGKEDGSYVRQTRDTAISADTPYSFGIDFFLEKGGSISGKVTNVEGLPLINISINAGEKSGTLTDAKGFFVMQGLPFGQYPVSSPSGGRWGSNDGTYLSQTRNTNISADSPDLIGVDFTLVKGGSISGTVKDTAGNPLANISMDAGDKGGWALTDANGKYAIRGLTFGPYTIGAPNGGRWGKNDGTYIRQTRATAVSTDLPDVTSLDFVLEKGGSIAGKVYDTNGKPLANISLDSGDRGGGASTDANGDYAILGLPFSPYTISAPSGGRWASNDAPYLGQSKNVTLYSVSANLSGVDFFLVKGGTISGTVKDAAGKPQANVSVDAGDKGGTLTDASGNYFIQGLPFGQYIVSSPSEGRRGSNDGTYLSQSKKTAVSTDSPDKSGIDFALVKGGTISGTVKDAAGNPLPNISLGAGEKDGTLTDANGNYVIQVLPFGQYSVIAPSVGRWGSNDGTYLSQTRNTAISADSPAATGIDFVLATGGSISVTIKDTAGKPLNSISLDIGDRTGVTDSNGRYITKILPFGQYSINAPSGRRWGTNDGTYLSQTKNTAISAVSPNATDIEFILEKSGSISGTVRDTTGKPLTNVSVDVGDKNGAVTDVFGNYLIKDLPFGQYSVGIPGKDLTGSNDSAYVQQAKSVTISSDAPAAKGSDFVLEKNFTGFTQGWIIPLFAVLCVELLIFFVLFQRKKKSRLEKRKT